MFLFLYIALFQKPLHLKIAFGKRREASNVKATQKWITDP
jgi:hypothetical protein